MAALLVPFLGTCGADAGGNNQNNGGTGSDDLTIACDKYGNLVYQSYYGLAVVADSDDCDTSNQLGDATPN